MKIAIYSRKSIETDKGESIKNQIQICKEYFLRRQNNIEFEIFEDEGFSGGNTNRPAFKLMMNKAKNKEFDIVACYKIDRIARNVVDFVSVYDDLNKMNVKLVSVTEGFDPGTPLGKLIMMILASFAEMERENIRQRVKDNMKEMAKMGKWTGGNVPFGYITERIEEGSKKATYLKLDNDKSSLVKEIFDYYIHAQSMHKTQKWLENDKGIKWCVSTVKNILTSPIYVKANESIITYLSNFGEVFGVPNGINGVITYNRRPYTNGKHRWNDKSMFYAVSKHDGLIEPEIWIKVQSLQEKNKTSPRPKVSQVSYFTNVLKCGKCGSSITVNYNHRNKDGSKNYVYVCTGRRFKGSAYCNSKQVSQPLLDEKIINTLAKFSRLEEDVFVNILGGYKQNDYKEKICLLQKKIESNKTKINNLVDKLMLISNEAALPVTKKIEELTIENENYKKDLLFLQQDEINSTFIDPHIVLDNLKSVVNILKNPLIDIETKRTAVESCAEEIKYIRPDKDNVEIEVSFL